MALSLEHLTRLLLATLDDVTRLAALVDTAMQQSDHPAFELSPDGVIWYLNRAACVAIGLDPQLAVGTRLVTYVNDGLMTQRRLEALSQHPQTQSWSDAWRREQQLIPCQLTGFAIPRSLASERPRLIVWAEPTPGPADPTQRVDDEPPVDTLIPGDRPVQAHDLDPLRQKLGLGVSRFCELLGMTPVTWYAWRRHLDAPLPSRTIALHMRLLDVFPELARLGAQPLDLQEALRTQRGVDLTFTELALLLGVERRAGYGWSRGYAASEPVQALTASLLYLVLNKSRQDWEQYQRLLDRQATLEGVDLQRTHSWSTGAQLSADASGTTSARTPRGRPFRTQTPAPTPDAADDANPPDAKPQRAPGKKPGKRRG